MGVGGVSRVLLACFLCFLCFDQTFAATHQAQMQTESQRFLGTSRALKITRHAIIAVFSVGILAAIGYTLYIVVFSNTPPEGGTVKRANLTFLSALITFADITRLFEIFIRYEKMQASKQEVASKPNRVHGAGSRPGHGKDKSQIQMRQLLFEAVMAGLMVVCGVGATVFSAAGTAILGEKSGKTNATLIISIIVLRLVFLATSLLVVNKVFLPKTTAGAGVAAAEIIKNVNLYGEWRGRAYLGETQVEKLAQLTHETEDVVASSVTDTEGLDTEGLDVEGTDTQAPPTPKKTEKELFQEQNVALSSVFGMVNIFSLFASIQAITLTSLLIENH